MPARILLIEDSQDYREILSFYLSSSGFAVQTASEGREGLEQARRQLCDLIVTDIMLPGHNGYEICALLKQDVRFQKIPIVVLTASKLQPKDEKLAKDCGADAFLPKSIEPRKLVQHIRRLLADSTASSAS